MPRALLGAADSFNSSGATIVPDNHKRRSLTQVHAHAHAHPLFGRQLHNQDSLEIQLNNDIGVGVDSGDDGMIGLLHDQHQANGLGGMSFMREYLNITNDQQEESEPVRSAYHAPIPAVSQIPVDTADYLEQLQATQRTNAPDEASRAPLPFNHYRPASAHSNHSHSSLDPSDYYSTTDMDTDDDLSSSSARPGLAVNSHIGDLGMGDMALASGQGQAPLEWPNFHNPGGDKQVPTSISPASLGAGVVSPSEIGSGPSPSAMSTGCESSTGGRRRRGGRPAAVIDESPEARAARIEHRRDINRRSAQKHRIRRKEENEVLQRKIDERDARIRQLEQELAVEKGRVSTLKGFVNTGMSGMFGRENGSGI